MSTETPAATAEPTPTTPTTDGTPDEPLGEAGLSALKSEREARAAAEKAAKDALAKVKEYEDRDKSEAERQAERLAELERDNARLASEKTRAEVAAAKGVPAALLTGSTQEELEAAADALIAFKGDPQPQKLHIPNEGKAPSSTTKTTAELFAEAVEDAI